MLKGGDFSLLDVPIMDTQRDFKFDLEKLLQISLVRIQGRKNIPMGNMGKNYSLIRGSNFSSKKKVTIKS